MWEPFSYRRVSPIRDPYRFALPLLSWWSLHWNRSRATVSAPNFWHLSVHWIHLYDRRFSVSKKERNTKKANIWVLSVWKRSHFQTIFGTPLLRSFRKAWKALLRSSMILQQTSSLQLILRRKALVTAVYLSKKRMKFNRYFTSTNYNCTLAVCQIKTFTT